MSEGSTMKRLGDLVRVRTGKLDANASSPDGAYPFFTCSQEPLQISSFSYDCECVLVAGNGDLNVKYYSGKFDAYQRTYIVESVDKAKLDVRYLFYFLSLYVQKLRLMSIGGVIKYIKLDYLTEARLPLPELAEQRRIAKILDRAEALRSTRRSGLAQLDVLTRSIFLDLFGDPATNPKGWTPIVLGDVVKSVSDGPHVSPSYSSAGVPFLSTRHIRPGAIDWTDLKFITPADAEVHWRKCRPERGDVLYTKGGTTGMAAVVDTDRPFAIWVHIALLKTDTRKVEPTWLESMLNSSYCYHQSQILTHGIANRDLGLTRMVKIKMYLPPLSLQGEFTRRMASLAKLKSTQEIGLAKLDSLLTALQYRAFRGEL